MDEIITFVTKGYTVTDILMIISLIVVIVRCIERFCKWCLNHLKSYYYRKKGIEDKEKTLKSHSTEIKELTQRIDKMAIEVEKHYNLLIEKIDKQNTKLEILDRDGKHRDCALLRDRIIGGMRYFAQNTDERGKVHISVGDHESMSQLYEEYFNCGGNGTVKQMYDNEFAKWIVDR